MPECEKRGKPTLIAYDVLFADAHLCVEFPYGVDTWSGAESDTALFVLRAGATFVGESTLPDQGFCLDAPGVLERRVVFPSAGQSGAAAALGTSF